MSRDNTLFCDGDLPATLERQRKKAAQEVNSLNDAIFDRSSDETLVDEICSRYRLAPVVIHRNRLTLDGHEAPVDVSNNWLYAPRDDGRRSYAQGFEFVFFLPYEGDGALFKMRGSSWSTYTPSAEVDDRAKRLVLRAKLLPEADVEATKRRLMEAIDSICATVASHAREIERYHIDLADAVRKAVQARRNHREKLLGFTKQFNLPLERDEKAPSFAPAVVQRRAAVPLVKRQLPAASKPIDREPSISDEAYDEILGIIRHAGRSFELVPQTYKGLGEEGLRDIVLSHLNVSFPGKASGETFLKYGKTDICVMSEERRAFVGECKVWDGEKVLLDALKQLFDYLTWRESKSALILFNKTVAGFSALQEKIGQVLQQHPLLLREKTAAAGEWRHVFRHPEDERREVTVHTFMFDVRVAAHRVGKKR